MNMKRINPLVKNPNVEKLTASNVQYTQEFKLRAIKAYNSGVPAEQIFADAGLEVSTFGKGYARKSISRWIQEVEKYGAKKLGDERRGVGATGRPGVKKFKSLEEENAYLRAENDFLKKLHALEKKYDKKKSTK